jgi:hypothetical protein
MFLINMPEFQAPNGKLRPLLMTVLDVMIMHFQYVFQTYSQQNSMVKMMIRAAIWCKMASTESEAIQKLEFWSMTSRTT